MAENDDNTMALGALADAFDAALWEVKYDGGKIRVNFSPVFHKILGYSEGELSTDGYSALFSLVHQEDLPRVKNMIRNLLSGKTPIAEGSFRVTRKNGDCSLAYNFAAVTERGEDGGAARVTGGLRFVPAASYEAFEARLKESSSELESSYKAMASLFDNSVNPCFVFDDKFSMINCNNAAATLFGAPSKKYLIKNFYRFSADMIPIVQPDGHPSLTLAERLRQVVLRGRVSFDTYLRIGGEIKPYNATIVKIPYNGSFALSGQLVDTTQLTAARQALIHRDNLLVTVNRVAVSLMNYETSEERLVGGESSRVLCALDMLGCAINADMAIVWRNFEGADGLIYSEQLEIWSRDGKRLPLDTLPFSSVLPGFGSGRHIIETLNMPIEEAPSEMRRVYRKNIYASLIKSILVVPVNMGGAFWGFITFENHREGKKFTREEEDIITSACVLISSVITIDTTMRKLTEAERTALAGSIAKSEFLSRMSHEIRTPLNAVIGMTEIARRSGDPERVAECLEKITDSSRQLLGIINDVLDMSKIESGKLGITNSEFDFRKMIERAVTVTKVKFEEKRLNFSLSFSEPFERYIISDELRFSQVIINLLNNAGKFTPDGGYVTLNIIKAILSDDTAHIRVEVLDTGIGISKDAQSRLFNSFEQADGSISRTYGGTGLGLAICKKIIELMGGRIWVESEPGDGAAFIFELDVARGQKIAEPDGLSSFGEATHNWPGKRLLIVDDIAINREIIESLIEDTGVVCFQAADGRRACESVRGEDCFDAILMDVQMPVLDGIKATKVIRSMDGPKGRTPVYAMTANAFKEDVDRCVKAGMNGHIAKPVDVDELLKVLAEAFSAR
ncbi:MAG: response regulator [Clostridiales bacterium]|jgi:PAS domain S-box-containing protein|nr:response regulator [Clostridiales bacterium]